MKYLAVLLIRFYQKFISPLFPPRCRYYPTCSRYALEAFQKHGFFKGFILSAWRLLRCNPFSRGGVDFVPEKFEWAYFRKKNNKAQTCDDIDEDI